MSIDEGQKIEQTTNNFDEAVDSDGYLADVETPGPKVPKRKASKLKSKKTSVKRENSKRQKLYISDTEDENSMDNVVKEKKEAKAMDTPSSDGDSYAIAGHESESDFSKVGTEDGDPIVTRDREGRAVEYEPEDSTPPKNTFKNSLKAMSKTFFPRKN